MSDRYVGYVPTPSGRSPTFNVARASMPTSVGYSSMYAGDMHVVPSASQRHYITPRGYSTSTTTSGVPTTTRTYAVTQNPRASSRTRDGSRTRRSTLDSASRPPVIITTTQLDRRHGSSSHSTNARSGSPIRDDFRASDGQVYSQPASSMRPRRAPRSYYVSSPSEDFGRYRDRTDSHLSSRDLEAYRNSRPSVIYPSEPRHSTAAIDYGDDGYQYTNAGELVKYDLDQSKPSRSRRHDRHDSFDAGYYRPNVNYDLDRRNLNINTSHDLNRPPNGVSTRQHDGRSGPPPSTRGFDKINRAYDARDVPPAVPVPPSPTGATSQLEIPTGSGRRPRPLSLHQEAGLRSSHHDELYRSREDERAMRAMRDLDFERRPEPPRFYDDNVPSRGFGIRTDHLTHPEETKERRREPRLNDLRKRSDEEVSYGSDKDREDRRWNRQGPVDDRRDWRQTKRDEENQDRERSRTRETLSGGLGAAAAAASLAASTKPGEMRGQGSPGPKSHRSLPDDGEIHNEAIPEQDPRQSFERVSKPVGGKEVLRERELFREKEPPQERDHPRERPPAPERDVLVSKEPVREPVPRRERDPVRESVKDPLREKEFTREELRDDGGFERRRPDADFRMSREPVRSTGSDSDDTKRSSRRGRASQAFNPNDASDLKQLKEQLASMEMSDKRREVERPTPAEKPRGRSPSPSKKRAPHVSSRESFQEKSGEESRGREDIGPAAQGKQVRLVSPPKEKSEGKPLKGILKQPKASFPEEANPVREGVAPHKEDKKLKEAPPGARWTKINRKIVNPEALTIGKERFEVRDDFVIVLRVLSKEEIQAYAAATQVLRERRRNKTEGRKEGDDDHGRERDEVNEEDGEHHRHRRHRESEEESDEKERHRNREKDRQRERDRESEREGDRQRHHRRDEADDYDDRGRDDHHYHQRSFRERERDLEAKN
ncbi:uncharacterized protein MAM_07887 [Metarhizium album ARSEF 1941]|uniref:DUF8035 domain-containing protein n=1 Tax=Metarhizium album (strain ARSEF 1941) TaxID=1081103 RepID=A0A0B2WEK2_METAS|nr:uncharacterized protein MAM_07887 [Metarhizium album ARSEF 1941]KHN94251.1 hypothetical protein MAM_07887 [Metarhizium album ARSEF 1941]